MRFRQMATYRGVPYEVGVGPSESDVVLFAACPPPEELGFEPAPGHWRKRVIRAEVDVLWESRPIGTFHGEACLVLDDLGDRLHIVYLGKDARRARELGLLAGGPGRVRAAHAPGRGHQPDRGEGGEEPAPRPAGARRATAAFLSVRRAALVGRAAGRPGPGRRPRPWLPGRAGPGPGGRLDRERRAAAVERQRHRRAPPPARLRPRPAARTAGPATAPARSPR